MMFQSLFTFRLLARVEAEMSKWSGRSNLWDVGNFKHTVQKVPISDIKGAPFSKFLFATLEKSGLGSK